MAVINVTTESLQKSALRYRKELIQIPVRVLKDKFLNYATLRTGIRYAEVQDAELKGDVELGPYDEDRIDDEDVKMEARTLYTYFGDVVKRFSPNSLYSTIHGDAVTKGEGLKNTEMSKAMVAFMAAKVGNSLYKSLWKAVRNDKGKRTVDLFDGYDTITTKEIQTGNISVENGNFMDLDLSTINATNAVDILKSFWRSADEMLQDQKCILFVAPSIFNAYCDDYKAVTGNIAYNREFNQTFVEGSEDKCQIVPLSNKANSSYMHLTVKQNMLVGVNGEGEEEQVSVEKYSPFKLTFVMTSFFGVQFNTISKEYMMVAGKAPASPDNGDAPAAPDDGK
ncbi:MAG: hypothetical protein LKE54_04530 [Prevotella sp.]|jgi:hypothetical protein|nr:hypothetical protein [Prevotella sp.]MCH3994309.1 hypothetical protein [Prevotella sp.]